MKPVRAAGPVSLAVVLLAGCGSTVQGPATGVGTQGGSAGLSVGAPQATSAAGPSSGPATVSVPGGSTAAGDGLTGPSAVTGTTSSGASSGAAGAPAPVPAQSAEQVLGPGITPTTIYFGAEYSSRASTESKAIGASGAATSYDFRDIVNTIVHYANVHGGFAGRKLQVIYYDVNDNNNRDIEDQSACSDFTQDHKVFAMIGTSDILRQCAENAHAVSMVDPATVASTYQRFPHFIAPYNIRLDRLGPVTVNGIYRAGYFGGKLGLVTWDDPNYRYAMTNGYLPALASHGIKPAIDPVYITVPQQVGALGDMSASVSSAVAKFKSLGIDHVIIQDGPAGVFGGTGLTLEWMETAESQHYYPRYGQNSDNAPGWSVLPSDQQDKAVAVLSGDFDPSYDAGWHPNRTREKCYKIEADGGYPVKTDGPNNDEGVASQACDQIFFLQRVINSLSTVLTADNFIQAAARIGTSFPNATVYGTNLFPGRRDGLDKVRTAVYYASCKCLKFRTPPFQPD